MDTGDSAKRARLLAIKLRTLVRDHLGSEADAQTGSFGHGAALVRDGRAWVLLDHHPSTGLGPALAWMRQQGCAELSVIAESGTGILARRAALLDLPVDVWYAEGRTLLPALAEPYPDPSAVPAAHLAFRDTIIGGGAEPEVEHGVLVGEVAGLEVCRVVHDPFLGVDRLEVGVGAHDREAFQIMHGDRPTADSLARIVAVVAQQRRADSDPHPLNRLAAERLLRAQLIADPARLGLRTLRTAEPPVPRANLKDPTPCVAVGETSDGTPCVVVCSVGVDLDAALFAADARAALRLPHASLLLVVPPRDGIAVTRWLAGLVGATVVTQP